MPDVLTWVRRAPDSWLHNLHYLAFLFWLRMLSGPLSNVFCVRSAPNILQNENCQFDTAATLACIAPMHMSRSPLWGSNPRPYAYEAHALPTELRRHMRCRLRMLFLPMLQACEGLDPPRYRMWVDMWNVCILLWSKKMKPEDITERTTNIRIANHNQLFYKQIE